MFKRQIEFTKIMNFLEGTAYELPKESHFSFWMFLQGKLDFLKDNDYDAESFNSAIKFYNENNNQKFKKISKEHADHYHLPIEDQNKLSVWDVIDSIVFGALLFVIVIIGLTIILMLF